MCFWACESTGKWYVFLPLTNFLEIKNLIYLFAGSTAFINVIDNSLGEKYLTENITKSSLLKQFTNFITKLDEHKDILDLCKYLQSNMFAHAGNYFDEILGFAVTGSSTAEEDMIIQVTNAVAITDDKILQLQEGATEMLILISKLNEEIKDQIKVFYHFHARGEKELKLLRWKT
jgi:hypothetical protein